MRLRFLHLPRVGPLADISILFGRDHRLAEAIGCRRTGSLNFLVGINGSGKSSLLRTIFQAFRAFAVQDWPAVPMTIAWDQSSGDKTSTVIVHSSNHPDANSYLALLEPLPHEFTKPDWQCLCDELPSGKTSAPLVIHQFIQGVEAVRNPLLYAHLPKRLVGYTSGTTELWEQLEWPDYQPKTEDEGLLETGDDRPPGWSMVQEWKEQQPIRIANVLSRFALDQSGTQESIPGVGQVGQLDADTVAQLQSELTPLNALRNKLLANQMAPSDPLQASHFRIGPRHLRMAGIIMAIWQAAKEMPGHQADHDREALRRKFLLSDSDTQHDVRRILNKLDWFWPTHLSLTYHDADDRVSALQHLELLCLIALADEVVSLPSGRQRLIFSLGPAEGISLKRKLEEIFPYGITSQVIEFTAERIEGCKTGAEAVLRLFSEDKNIESTPFDVFNRLRDWERTGLLEHLTLTVRRLGSANEDTEQDPAVVCYDQLSDGEQVLLGRMGLLFLLRGQNGSLLLMDEPETHFNDAWKRELVDMIDSGLLDTTDANVLVATHTSIALTDAFAAEVSVIQRNTEDGLSRSHEVGGGLFGTDPGEVAMALFGADSSIGSRSLEALEKLLKTDWKGREDELEAIINLLGSSFHRAELRAELHRLRNTNNAASPA
jgi:predicted ATPase